MEFGSWPQRIKADSVNVDDSASGKSETVGMFTYYEGDDGEWYCKALENAYEAKEHYKYSNGTQVAQKSTNSYKWFKVEPIKWRVLTNNYKGKKLLLAESILMANVQYYDDANTRTIGIQTVNPNNYEHSKIRAWLNGIAYRKGNSNNAEYESKGFLQTAFMPEELAEIADTEVDNFAESTTDAGNNLPPAIDFVCNNTTDKIFLLSQREATTSEYGFTAYEVSGAGTNRIKMPTDFALANSAEKSDTTGYGTDWWLRSPYFTYMLNQYRVNEDGRTNVHGYANIDPAYSGIVPALCLK